jgi:hypothetical protein
VLQRILVIYLSFSESGRDQIRTLYQTALNDPQRHQ